VRNDERRVDLGFCNVAQDVNYSIGIGHSPEKIKIN
jgi:hypothetical protein